MDDTDNYPESEGKGTLATEFSGSDASAGSVESKAEGALFGPDDFGIYVNKITLDAYIFHGQSFGDIFERLDFDWSDNSVTVHKKDGTSLDLGSKIQWLVRPYFKKISEISIVQTRDGEAIEGFVVPVKHVNKPEEA